MMKFYTASCLEYQKEGSWVTFPFAFVLLFDGLHVLPVMKEFVCPVFRPDC